MSAERHDPGDAECLVFTYKEGLLSKVAHDLKLRVGRFSIERDGAKVTARFDLTSLTAVCAVRDGHDDLHALSRGDLAKIDDNTRSEVLHSGRFPEAVFEGEVEGDAVRGRLTLHGVTRALSTTLRSEGGRRVAEVTLHQPDYGVTPYTAMMGTLRVKADVRVRVSVPG